MLAKKRLTDRAIAALKPAPAGKRLLVWDAEVAGLAVRVTDTGAKSFVLVARYPGSPNPAPRTIGKVGAVGLADARGKAREWLKLLTGGIDPGAVQAQREAETVEAVCEEWLRRSQLRSEDWTRKALERLVYPTLGSKPVSEVRRSDIVRLLDRIEDGRGKEMAEKTLGILRSAMNWWAARSDDFRSPIVRGMSRTAGTRRDRILTDDELRLVWRATDPQGFGAMVRFLLLTGARRSEAARMEWNEITNDEWTLPASRNKTGQELIRPLSGAALAILEGLPRGGRFVFTLGKSIDFGPCKSALLEASGTKGWTLHDLRRTARSLMSRAGVPSDHAEHCLGHVIGGVRGVYDRHQYRDEMLRAYEKLAALISGIVEPRENVVAIRGSDDAGARSRLARRHRAVAGLRLRRPGGS
jgi:integrase